MELEQATVHQLAEALAKGEVSSVELTKAYLQRIEQIDGRMGAYLTVTAEQALSQAEQADRQRKESGASNVNPLCGVPVAVKDNLVTNGVRTTCASILLETYIPPYDATVVSRLKAAGMPMLGKTNLDEFSMGSSTETSALGTTRNPWDLKRVPGGSSGGSAAAVAAGLAPLAIGSDTGGSIRQPAAFCGIVGIRPSYGRVPRQGAVALAPSMDQVGPMAQNVMDAALLLQVIAGHDPSEGTSARVPVPDYTGALSGGVQGLRVGLVKEFLEGDLAAEIDPEIRTSVEQAARDLEALGAQVVPISLPTLKYSMAVYSILVAAEANSSMGRFDGVRYGRRVADAPDVFTMYKQSRGQGFGAEVKRRILFGTYVITGERYEQYYMKALRSRTLIKQDMDQALTSCDVLLMPTTPEVAFELGADTSRQRAYLHDLCTTASSLAGLPSVSLPVGLSSGSLPMAVQIVGRRFDEVQMLQVAYALEQKTGPLPRPRIQVDEAVQ